MKKEIIQSIKIIIIGLALSTGIAFAQNWSAPTSAPTAGNTLPPIDVSSSSQIKSGALATGQLAVFGVSSLYGDVVILPTTRSTNVPPPLISFLNDFKFVKIAYASLPTLTEITPVPDPTTDHTPNYTLNAGTAGTLSYSGHCSSPTTSVASGNTTITFNTLLDGTYSDCLIRLNTSSSGSSLWLQVSSFTITTAPNNSPPPPSGPTSGNLYVSGKMGIGIANPVEEVEVSGNVKVRSLVNSTAGPLRVCADTAGKLVFCPSYQ